ncbi:MAG: Nif3-like dinuclear metal center hexameric protein [Oscillospiraceae bacterium]|jgi:dinuclear metal center YbgI/SA1388 family protein
MATVNELRTYFETRVPTALKMDFDNVGLLVGTCDTTVHRTLVTLDITDDVIEEAIQGKVDLIVSHHPLFFDLKFVRDDDDTGRKIIRLLQHGISAICLHTNLDAVEGGVNDALMQALGAKVTGLLSVDGTTPDGKPYGISRVGELDAECALDAFLFKVKSALQANGLRYHDGGRAVKKLAVCGGSGGGDLPTVIAAGCDTFVTADIKYHQFLMAKEHHINLIDADHYATEQVVVPVLASLLQKQFPEIDTKLSATHKQTAQFY